MFGWGTTISVNSVIGAHFLTEMNFSFEFIINEIMLVVIGITIAVSPFEETVYCVQRHNPSDISYSPQ